MARRSDTDSCIGCFILAVAAIAVIGFLVSVLDDTASKPPSETEPPQLEEAAFYVTGDDGGAYKVSYVIWTPEGAALREGEVTDVIEPEPHSYSINLKGFENNRDDFFLSPADLEIEARKTEPWEGDLTVVLEVNDRIVDCVTNNDDSPNTANTYSVAFDANNREEYERDFGCKLNLWFF